MAATYLATLCLVVALLMVSRIPYPHLVTQLLLRGSVVFPMWWESSLRLMVLLSVRWYAVPALCCLYAAWPGLYV